jgi:thioredoxin reductase (NADPH)
MSYNCYDVVIVGGGAAGLTAAIYASRYGLKTLVFSDSFGGTITYAHKVCNYPGFTEISGMEWSERVLEQVQSLDVEVIFEKVMAIDKKEKVFIVNSDQRTVKAKKIILAIGRSRKKLGVDREEELTGKGISYCATCDGGFYKGKVVGVVGGSDAAVTSALLLADIATKVYLIYRKEELRAEKAWVDLAKAKQNIEILYKAEVAELLGQEKLEGIKLNTGKELKIDGLFIEIGSVPNTELLSKLNVSLDENKFIIVNKEQKTNIAGIFAAGDATNASDLKQVITSASQGAIAAYHCYLDIKESE